MVFAKLSIILIILTPLTLFAQVNRSKLPLLATKQTLQSLRFVSLDGRFNYYQRRSGALMLSLNYQVKEVLQGTQGAQYTLSASPSRKKIIISQDQTYHDFLSLRQSQKIYVVDYGQEAPTYIDEGLFPILHLDDTWISFFDAQSRYYHFRNFANQALRFNIRLNNTRNPYFVPQAHMHTDSLVLYTDLNQAGIVGLLLFNRQQNQAQLITKVDHPDQTLEFCINGPTFYLLQKGINDSSYGTRIFRGEVEKIIAGEVPEQIYSSERNDLGHLECNADNLALYFIKNTGTKPNLHNYEVAKLTLETLATEVVSDLNFVTQMINLDGRLLIPFRGQYYVVLGDSDLTEEDRLSPSVAPPPPAGETP
jgi:hypothetical protein